MQDLKGKTAFITGGASGVGYGMAHAFLKAGMNVVIADIRAEQLASATEQLKKISENVHGIQVDITDREAMAKAADETETRFGKVHMLCNNAGINVFGPIEDANYDDWDWVMDVNLNSVFNGIKSFLPKLKAHGEGGHIVNTASMAGMQSGLGFSPYTASKFAVVGMSEGLAPQLAPFGIGVSVLCPGFVRTRIGDSGRNRPEQYGPTQTIDSASPTAALVAQIAELIQSGLEPSEVAARVLAAIRANELYVFTHADMRAEVENRFTAIAAAFDKTAARRPG